MPRSTNRILVHLVWSTKFREPFITSEIEETVYSFLKDQLEKMGCRVIIINGMPDHVHTLFYLNATKSISEVAKQIKGSSSFFINENQLCNSHFKWGGGYAVFPVSKNRKEQLIFYIRNQKAHHAKKLKKASQ